MPRELTHPFATAPRIIHLSLLLLLSYAAWNAHLEQNKTSLSMGIAQDIPHAGTKASSVQVLPESPARAVPAPMQAAGSSAVLPAEPITVVVEQPAADPAGPHSPMASQGLKVVFQVMPTYPRAASLEYREGTVVLRIQVVETGAVGAVVVERSSGYQDLDEAAVSAARQWQFSPAAAGGSPVSSSALLPIVFTLEG